MWIQIEKNIAIHWNERENVLKLMIGLELNSWMNIKQIFSLSHSNTKPNRAVSFHTNLVKIKEKWKIKSSSDFVPVFFSVGKTTTIDKVKWFEFVCALNFVCNKY